MSKIVIDASALLRFVDNEAGADRVESLLNRARVGELDLLMSAVNWGEVGYAVLKAHGLEQARVLLPKLSSVPLRIVPVDRDDAERAAAFKHAHRIPYADSFAGSLALTEGAPLVTADHDFRSLPRSLVKVDILPVKSKPGVRRSV